MPSRFLRRRPEASYLDRLDHLAIFIDTFGDHNRAAVRWANKEADIACTVRALFRRSDPSFWASPREPLLLLVIISL
jgi:hypothetical protein